MWVKVGQVQACCGFSRPGDTSLEILYRAFPDQLKKLSAYLKDSACSVKLIICLFS